MCNTYRLAQTREDRHPDKPHELQADTSTLSNNISLAPFEQTVIGGSSRIIEDDELPALESIGPRMGWHLVGCQMLPLRAVPEHRREYLMTWSIPRVLKVS